MAGWDDASHVEGELLDASETGWKLGKRCAVMTTRCSDYRCVVAGSYDEAVDATRWKITHLETSLS